MLLCALRANSHDVHGLPRFRTNDVLLGTSGVYCRGSIAGRASTRSTFLQHLQRDFVVEFVVEALQPNRQEGSDSKRSSRTNGVSPSLLEL